MTNSDSDVIEKNTDFGSVLAEAREAQGYSVEEVFEHIKIPENVISAIEANNIDALPGATFAQGYIRTYAKFLEISEDRVLEMYNRAVPDKLATDLKPRSNLRAANSQSPLIKMMTVVLIIAGLFTAIYGGFKYYQKKAAVLETEMESKEQRFTGNSLDSPGEQAIDIQQNARITADDELIVEEAVSVDSPDETLEPDVAEKQESVSEDNEKQASVSEENVLPPEVEEPQEISKKDVIEFYAELGSWMEVRDASKARLFYNMVPRGQTKVITGQAPFSVSMGNAKTTRVVINDLEIDATNYIRSNNTASFKVSTQGQDIIFH